MKEISISKGMTVFVDDSDFEFLSKYKWYAIKSSNTFYAYSKQPTGKSIAMHRLLLGVEGGTFVDHRDGNGLNNCRDNIRECTLSQNSFNRCKLSNASSKYKGVSRKRKKWKASIYKDRKHYYIGTFDSEDQAAKAYNDFADKLHGSFALKNNIGKGSDTTY